MRIGVYRLIIVKLTISPTVEENVMANIKRYPWISHFLGSPTGYVVHLQKGTVKHQGVGQAFWFRPANSVLSEIPG
jgi:hypothetical protein